MNDDIYYLKVGEYDLTPRIVCFETILLSFSRNCDKGVSESLTFTIPLHNTQSDNEFSKFMKYCDSQEYPL